MRGDKYAAREPVRMMIVGYPGMAKTGGLAALVDMGYKLRVIDFDGNLLPLFTYTTKKENLKNVDIVSFSDKLGAGSKFIETKGIPEAFPNAVKLSEHWKYKDEDTGEEVDLGYSRDWGSDTIMVLDSNTAMGEASFRRTMAMLNKTPQNMTQQGWGLAMKDQNDFLEIITSPRNKYHTVVIGHLKMIGPKDINRDDDALTKDLKERMAALVDTRLFPAALGQNLPQEIAKHFPILIEAAVNKKGERVYRTKPRPELDLKIPLIGAKAEYSVSTGLAEIFQALAPPLETGVVATTPHEAVTKEKSE